jgi:hypothetical protein
LSSLFDAAACFFCSPGTFDVRDDLADVRLHELVPPVWSGW